MSFFVNTSRIFSFIFQNLVDFLITYLLYSRVTIQKLFKKDSVKTHATKQNKKDLYTKIFVKWIENKPAKQFQTFIAESEENAKQHDITKIFFLFDTHKNYNSKPFQHLSDIKIFIIITHSKTLSQHHKNHTETPHKHFRNKPTIKNFGTFYKKKVPHASPHSTLNHH